MNSKLDRQLLHQHAMFYQFDTLLQPLRSGDQILRQQNRYYTQFLIIFAAVFLLIVLENFLTTSYFKIKLYNQTLSLLTCETVSVITSNIAFIVPLWPLRKSHNSPAISTSSGEKNFLNSIK